MGRKRLKPYRQVKNLLKQQRRRFRKKFGRDRGPADPVFFDPDADEPRPLDFEPRRRDEAFEKATPENPNTVSWRIDVS